MVMSFNQVYLKALEAILKEGEYVSPRGMPVKEVLAYQFMIDPHDNIITIPGFKTNEKYAKEELAWYLNGDNRIDFSPLIQKTWEKYSDDGVHVNSAYGHRIFGGHPSVGINQWTWVLKKLTEDPDSRQCVMNVNVPSDKLQPTKDFCCFSASTIVHSPEGDLTIKNLAQKFSNGLDKYPVWSLNEKTKEVELDWAINCQKTGKKHTIRIIMDSGDCIKCTPEHQILVKRRKRNGNEKNHGSSVTYNWINASDLVEGDELVYMRYYRMRRNSGVSIKSKLHMSSIRSNRKFVHREYLRFAGKFDDSLVVHHIDFNPSNNSTSNLLQLTSEQHNKFHMVVKNPNKKSFQHKINYGSPTFNFEQIMKYNKGRKVIKIEHGYEFRKIDVYDLSTLKNHNFFINGGMCVHNCTMYVQVFQRDGKLHWITNMRSQDIHYGTRNDVFCFTELQKRMARDLQIEPGKYIHFSGSLHLYQPQWKLAEAAVHGFSDRTLP